MSDSSCSCSNATHSALPIACNLPEPELQQRKALLLETIKTHIRDIKPLDQGYAFCFSPDDRAFEAATEIIRLERTCCAFLRFQMTVEPDHGPIRLELTGPEGTRAFLKHELALIP